MGEYHEEMKKIANKYDVEYESDEICKISVPTINSLQRKMLKGL